MSTTSEDFLSEKGRQKRRAGIPVTKRTAVYVYQAPLRVWHWVNALSITVLAITGWFIANPLPTVSGEASDHFVMGYIRFFHFAAGYVFAVGFLFRIYWAFVGNRYSRQLFTLPFWRRSFWSELWHEVRWYAFKEPEPHKYYGHNPLAHLFMVVIITVFVMLHVYTAIREDVMSRQSLISTMISGWRMFKDDRP